MFLRRPLATLAAGAVVGLAALTAEAASIPSDQASYAVPLTGDAAEHGVFSSVEGLEWTIDGDSVSLSYVLPVDLVGGHTLRVRMTGRLIAGPTPRASLASEQAEATCLIGRTTVCLTTYIGSVIFNGDVAGAAEESARYLREKYPGASDLPQRLAVSRSFHNEPDGVLTFVSPR